MSVLNRSLIFSLLLSTQVLSIEKPKVRFSPNTEKYFQEGIKSCSKYTPDHKASADKYYKCFENSKNNSRDVYCETMFDQFLKDIDCKDNFNKPFMGLVNKDIIDLHEYEVSELKAAIYDFRAKGLSGSAQIAAYENYLKEHSLEEFFASKSVFELKQSLSATFEKRKETCSDVNNLKEPLSQERPRNQDSIGWCYAYTASDIISHALGKEVSAVYLATKFNQEDDWKKKKKTEGGYIDRSLNLGLKNGVCLEADAPSTDYTYSLKVPSVKKFVEDINLIGGSYSNGDKAKRANAFRLLCEPQNWDFLGLATFFPKMTPEQLVEILKESGRNSYDAVVLNCPLIKDPLFDKLEVKKVLGSKIFPSIDEQLESGNIVGIHYSGETISSYKKRDKKIFNHASTIVGRRFNPRTNSCEYHLRNSFGKTCADVDPNYECNNGHYWIAEDFLKYTNTIHEAIYVEKK